MSSIIQMANSIQPAEIIQPAESIHACYYNIKKEVKCRIFVQFPISALRPCSGVKYVSNVHVCYIDRQIEVCRGRYRAALTANAIAFHFHTTLKCHLCLARLHYCPRPPLNSRLNMLNGVNVFLDAHLTLEESQYAVRQCLGRVIRLKRVEARFKRCYLSLAAILHVFSFLLICQKVMARRPWIDYPKLSQCGDTPYPSTATIDGVHILAQICTSNNSISGEYHILIASACHPVSF